MEEIIAYKIIPTSIYFEDVDKHKKSGQLKVINKIMTFLKEIKNTPSVGTGKPEPLKGYAERNVYSRRIDQKHRLIDEVFEEEKKVELLSCYGHYDDK